MKRFLFTLLLVTSQSLLIGSINVLHYTETKGYNHNTKSQSLAMFSGYPDVIVTNDDNGSEFNSLSNLQQYEVVVFSNTSGKDGLSAVQKANFESYIATGGSYLGIHAASDTERHPTANGNTGNWPYYAQVVAGASVQQSPNHTSSSHNNTMIHLVPNHPILTGIPSPWNKTEEYYYWENGYLSPDTAWIDLLEVGQTGSKSYDAPRMTARVRDLPGGGRAFYTSLGHDKLNFTNDQNFIQLIYNALLYIAPPTAFAVEYIAVSVEGATISWELSNDLDSLLIESYENGIWIPVHSSRDTIGSFTLTSCSPKVLRLVAWDQNGEASISNTLSTKLQGSYQENTGFYSWPCGDDHPEAYQLFDLQGRLIDTDYTITEDGQQRINLSGLPAGQYILSVDRKFHRQLIQK